jgi:dihydroorotate dehydrogenase electron transfer subunit
MPVLESSPMVHATTVVDRREPGPGVAVIGLHAPQLASVARPGQFVMVVPPSGESVATALGIYEASSERVSLMVVVVGHRTAELAALAPGERVDVVGPLGIGFDIPALGGDVAIVAGGVGIASLYLVAEQVARNGGRPQLYYGARNAGALVDVGLFKRLCSGIALATDDGSHGHRGYVTDLLQRESVRGTIAACGPTPMLRSVATVARRLEVRAQLALEEQFACGVGACWGCVVPIDRRSRQAPRFPAPPSGDAREYVHARICKEGPVFWAHDLRW